jgi:hypothetical protein
MIEKLQEGEFRESVITAKLNELIDSHNEFRAQMYPLEATIEEDFSVTWKVNSSYREEHK